MTYADHKKSAPSNARFVILVIGDSRYKQYKEGQEFSDESSITAKRTIEEKGFVVSARQLVPDDSARIIGSLLSLIEGDDCDAIVTIGGTGLAKRDVTIESVKKLVENGKEIPGFGEIFRSLSYLKIGTPAILSRALAGVIRDKPVFCLPGSPQSVELGLKELVLPEIGHILKHIRD
jgi:molybdenum cofactor biosynthesis protein B